MIETGTTNTTTFIEEGAVVYPCRCGETHRGDYGFYDYAMHECLHEDELYLSYEGDAEVLVMCPQCGMQWRAVGERRQRG